MGVIDDDKITYKDEDGKRCLITSSKTFTCTIQIMPGPVYVDMSGRFRYSQVNHSMEDNWLITTYYPSNASIIHIQIICGTLTRDIDRNCTEPIYPSILFNPYSPITPCPTITTSLCKSAAQTLDATLVVSSFTLSLNG